MNNLKFTLKIKPALWGGKSFKRSSLPFDSSLVTSENFSLEASEQVPGLWQIPGKGCWASDFPVSLPQFPQCDVLRWSGTVG